MIQIDRVNVSNLENAFHGLRNPMNSWNKSDSFFGFIGQKDIIDKAQKIAATYWDETLPGFDQKIYVIVVYGMKKVALVKRPPSRKNNLSQYIFVSLYLL